MVLIGFVLIGLVLIGLVEAELEDWKDARMVRLLAVDNGRLTYTDWKHGSWPVVLVTWPPRYVYIFELREKRERAEIKQKDRELIKRVGKRDLSLCLKH